MNSKNCRLAWLLLLGRGVYLYSVIWRVGCCWARVVRQNGLGFQAGQSVPEKFTGFLRFGTNSIEYRCELSLV